MLAADPVQPAPSIPDSVVAKAELAYWAAQDGVAVAQRCTAGMRAALETVWPTRERLAAAAHAHFCLIPGEATHEPDEIDYDKADEVLEILAHLDQSQPRDA